MEMFVARCGGSVTGTGACLTAQKSKLSRSAGGRSTNRIPFSPCSHPHRLRCSSVTSPGGEERPTTTKRSNEEWEVLKANIADEFKPLLRNISEICSLRRAYDLEDYQIGMLFGAILGSVGSYKLWKTAPSTLVNVTLAFVFYKLSVLSSQLHQCRKSNSLITRLKFGTILMMVLKDFKKNYVLLDVIRMPVFLLYLGAFLFDIAGLKKYGRAILISFVNHLKTRGGIQEIGRIMWIRGYVSPYDDGVDLSDFHA